MELFTQKKKFNSFLVRQSDFFHFCSGGEEGGGGEIGKKKNFSLVPLFVHKKNLGIKIGHLTAGKKKFTRVNNYKNSSNTFTLPQSSPSLS